MTDEQRFILVQRETERARHYLEQSREMLGLRHWDIAANRQYYACYHAVQALFVSRGISGSTHKGMISQFSRNFVKAGLIGVGYGSFLSRMMQLRQKADYNCYYDVSESEVREMNRLSEDFVRAVLNMIEES